MKEYKYKVSDIVISQGGDIGTIQQVDTTVTHGSPMEPRHYDYWVYFGAARESGYKESELKLMELSEEKKREYNQKFSFGQCVFVESPTPKTT